MATSSPYADYIESARSRIDFGDIEEIAAWKRNIIEGLRPALDAVRAGNSDWPTLVINGVTHKDDLVNWRAFYPLRQWFTPGSDDALNALRGLWTAEPVAASERIRTFFGALPSAVSLMRKGSGLRPVSVLLMALGSDYPPYKAQQFHRAYKHAGHPEPSGDADEGTLYEHAVAFLDRLVESSSGTPVDRLEAESILWLMDQAARLGPSLPERAWVIRAGREGERETYNLEHGLATMGWGNLQDLQGVKSRQDVEAMLRHEMTDKSDGTVRSFARQLWTLRSDVKCGDLVVLPLKMRSEIALGTVTQEYSYRADEELGWDQVVEVDWRRTDVLRSVVEPDLMRSLNLPPTISAVKDKDHVRRCLDSLGASRPSLQARRTPSFVCEGLIRVGGP